MIFKNKEQKKESVKIEKNKRSAFSLKFALLGLTILISTSLAVTKMFDDKYGNLSLEKIENVRMTNHLIKSDVDFKNYIQNFNYTDKMYKEDLIKYKKIEDILYANYQNYLKENKYSDNVSHEEFINELIANNPNIFHHVINKSLINANKYDLKRFESMMFTDFYHYRNGRKIENLSEVAKIESASATIAYEKYKDKINVRFNELFFSSKTSHYLFITFNKSENKDDLSYLKDIYKNKDSFKEVLKVNHAVSKLEKDNHFIDETWMQEEIINKYTLLKLGKKFQEVL